MKTEIPSEDGWYWVAVPTRAYQQVAKLFHDWGGSRSLMVMNSKTHTQFTVYSIGGQLNEDIQGAIFTKIKEPK